MPKRGADFLALSRVPFPTSAIATTGDPTMPKKTKKSPTKKPKKVAKKAPRALKKKMVPKALPRKPPTPPVTRGAVVTGTDPCTCGGAPEDHGRDPKYPGSTACTHCAECVAYEADPAETSFEDDHPTNADDADQKESS